MPVCNVVIVRLLPLQVAGQKQQMVVMPHYAIFGACMPAACCHCGW
jgi:hypothetical protein